VIIFEISSFSEISALICFLVGIYDFFRRLVGVRLGVPNSRFVGVRIIFTILYGLYHIYVFLVGATVLRTVGATAGAGVLVLWPVGAQA